MHGSQGWTKSVRRKKLLLLYSSSQSTEHRGSKFKIRIETKKKRQMTRSRNEHSTKTSHMFTCNVVLYLNDRCLLHVQYVCRRLRLSNYINKKHNFFILIDTIVTNPSTTPIKTKNYSTILGLSIVNHKPAYLAPSKVVKSGNEEK